MKTWLELAHSGRLGAARALEDRTVLFERGHPAKAVYFCESGTHEVYQSNEQGFSAVFKVVTAPTVVGSTELLADENEYLESARVLGRETVYRIERDEFFRLLAEFPEAAFESTVDVSQCLCGAARNEGSRMKETDALLATLLLAYADVAGLEKEGGTEIQLHRSQADLAGALGVSERSVNRILANWKEQDWVSKSSGHYVVKDLGVLLRISGNPMNVLVQRYRDHSQQTLFGPRR